MAIHVPTIGPRELVVLTLYSGRSRDFSGQGQNESRHYPCGIAAAAAGGAAAGTYCLGAVVLGRPPLRHAFPKLLSQMVWTVWGKLRQSPLSRQNPAFPRRRRPFLAAFMQQGLRGCSCFWRHVWVRLIIPPPSLQGSLVGCLGSQYRPHLVQGKGAWPYWPWPCWDSQRDIRFPTSTWIEPLLA